MSPMQTAITQQPIGTSSFPYHLLQDKKPITASALFYAGVCCIVPNEDPRYLCFTRSLCFCTYTGSALTGVTYLAITVQPTSPISIVWGILASFLAVDTTLLLTEICPIDA